MEKAIGYGMDLGTFRSMMAICNGKDVSPIVTDEFLTQGGFPSLFYCGEDGNEMVCEEVEENDLPEEDPDGVCASVKMKLQEKEINLNGYSYNPVTIMTKEATHIVEASQQEMEKRFVDKNFESLTVGVPVRFRADEKDAIMHIMSKATNGKKITLLPEPIAAALSYFHYSNAKTEKVLVFDMGCGTFDVVFLENNVKISLINPYPYIAKFPKGSNIAGDRIDLEIEQYLLNKLSLNSKIKMDSLLNKNHIDRKNLRLVARSFKEKLSRKKEHKERFFGIDCGMAELSMTKEELETLIKPLIQQNVDIAYSVLQESGMLNDKDLIVLLVGGSTYIPLVRTLIEKKFFWLDKSHIVQKFPEQAVALGCAIYNSTPIVQPKMTFGYAVDTYISSKKIQELHVRIPSNVELPFSARAFYYTLYEGQTGVTFRVYEVDNAEMDTYLPISSGRVTQYELKHKFGKKVPKSTRVELITKLDSDGRLSYTIDDFGITKPEEKYLSIINTVQD